MKLLVIGNCFDLTGWSEAACRLILACDHAGIDTVVRTVKLNNVPGDVPARVKDLQKKSSTGTTHCVQLLLPHLMEAAGRFKNIGMFFSETDSFPTNNWTERLNLMDEVWVCNRQQVRACQKSHVNKPVNVIPIPCDIDQYRQNYPPVPALLEYDGIFKFYFIGENNKRKNLAAVLKAFHLEFDPFEPVMLIVKTSKPGMNQEQASQYTQKLCSMVREGLKLYPNANYYHQELINTDRLTGDEMMSLHQSCDCIVCPSYGESISLPVQDALFFGKGVIASRNTGFEDYLTDENSWLINCREEPVFGQTDTFTDLNTGREIWYSPDILQMRRAMRQAYEDRDLLKAKGEAGMAMAENYTYTKIGKLIKDTLCS